MAEMPKVQDALSYLERVKQKFNDKPNVYIQFLEVMKDFKAQTIDTDGVIKRVKHLFEGNKELILGFNQFLPPGFKMELADLEREEAGANSNAKPMEFGHAVKYVAKIKSRYSAQPEIYEEFLRILKQYQLNRAVGDIYARVQKLFAGQKDLLEEFSFFLPDANPERDLANANGPKRGPKKNIIKTGRGGSTRGRGGRGGAARMIDNDRIKSKKYKDDEELDVEEEERPVKSVPAVKTVTYPAGSEKTIQILDRIKSSVPKGHYIQLLKCMHLMNTEVISLPEFISIVESLFADIRASELAEKFKTAIGYDEIEIYNQMQKNHTNYYAYTNSIDANATVAITPSYRQLPPDVPLPPCTGRTELCQSVLNDNFYSIPSGTEDFSFKITRKNQYEEAIFKAEDERYELDTIIECNNSVIKFFESELLLLQAKDSEEQLKYKLSEPLTAIQCRSICRIYGDHGNEVLALIAGSPKCAIPTVLARLRQKDAEWRKIKFDFKKTWRDVYEKNFIKSLDHRSFYFKQDDKKKTSAKGLIGELREINDQVFPNPMNKSKSFSSTLRPYGVASNDTGNATVFNDGHCMKFKLKDEAVHNEVLNLLLSVCETKVNGFEKQTFLEFYAAFIVPFFHLDPKRVNELLSAYDPYVKPEPFQTEKVKTGSKSAEDLLLATHTSLADVKVRAPIANILTDLLAFTCSTDKKYESTVQALSNVYKKQIPSFSPVQKKKPSTDLCASIFQKDSTFNTPVRPAESQFLLSSSKLYIIFRLYQLLYARLLRARELASKPIKPDNGDGYANFQKLLHDWLNGSVESAKFEDDCRFTLGAGSYCLFTLDKCGLQFIQSIHTLLTASEEVSNLWQFDWYVNYMQNIRKLSDQNAKNKLRNNYSCVMTSRTPEESFHVQIEFNPSNSELCFGLVENSLSNSIVNHAALSVSQDWSLFAHNATSKYVELDSTVNNCISSCGFSSLADAARDILSSNDIKVTIALNSSQYSFAEGSEDYFVRPNMLLAESDERMMRVAAWRSNFIVNAEAQAKNEENADAAALLSSLAGQAEAELAGQESDGDAENEEEEESFDEEEGEEREDEENEGEGGDADENAEDGENEDADAEMEDAENK